MDQELHRVIKNASQSAANLKLLPPGCAGSVEGSMTNARTGGAMEFMDYRAYREGDEIKHVDWRLYARSEQLMVRRFAQETDPRCDIIIDCSRSMDLYGKKAVAAGMGAALAQCALNASFSLQVWGLHDTLLNFTPAEEPLGWAFPETGSSGTALQHFELLKNGLYRKGIRIFISDLFFDISPGTLLRNLSSGGGKVIIVQIAGGCEIAPGLSGSVSVTDPETGESREIMVDPVCLERYRENLENFKCRYAESAKLHNAAILFLNADDYLDKWDMELFCREGIVQ